MSGAQATRRFRAGDALSASYTGLQWAVWGFRPSILENCRCFYTSGNREKAEKRKNAGPLPEKSGGPRVRLHKTWVLSFEKPLWKPRWALRFEKPANPKEEKWAGHHR